MVSGSAVRAAVWQAVGRGFNSKKGVGPSYSPCTKSKGGRLSLETTSPNGAPPGLAINSGGRVMGSGWMRARHGQRQGISTSDPTPTRLSPTAPTTPSQHCGRTFLNGKKKTPNLSHYTCPPSRRQLTPNRRQLTPNRRQLTRAGAGGNFRPNLVTFGSEKTSLRKSARILKGGGGSSPPPPCPCPPQLSLLE